MRKSTVKKTSVKKEVLEKKPIVKIPVKKVKTISKIVKPLFIEEPIIEINYSWDIESIEINNLTNVISQITYEFIGTLIDQTHTISGTIVISKTSDIPNKVETSDYKTLIKQEIIDYIISKVSERHLDVMKGMIIQNFKGTKIIDKTFWKS
jgi:hypothetical protein